MHILSKPNEISQDAIDRAFVDHVKDNFKQEKATENERVALARKEAATERGKTHPVLGKCVATIPARDYFRLVKKYGASEITPSKLLKII